MSKSRQLPGKVRDAIERYLRQQSGPISITLIHAAVTSSLGPVSRSSVRSSLNLQKAFKRVGRGVYVIDDHAR
jgi:Fe2+ or Zn2+ uptake regulation protein